MFKVLPTSPISSQSLSVTMTTPPTPFVHAVSGAMGGAMALILLYPLERIRTEMQRQLKMTAPPPPKRHDHHLTDDDVETIVFTSSPIKPPSSLMTSKDASIGESWSFETVHHDPLTQQQQHHHCNTDVEAANSTEEIFQDAVSEMKSDEMETPKPSSLMTTSLPPLQQEQQQQQQQQAIIECFRSLLQRNEVYRGIIPVVTTLAISNFIFFYMNEWFKNHLLPPTPSSSAAMKSATRTATVRYRSLLASSLAGICNVLLTNPLWVTNLRIATGDAKYNHLIPEMIHTIRQHNNNIVHLWSGTIASLLLVSNPVIQFFVYEELKTWQPKRKQSQPNSHKITPIQAFIIGAMAKMIATLLTYPIQVAQSLLRMQEKQNHTTLPSDTGTTAMRSTNPTECVSPPPSYTGTIDCLKQLYQQNGIISLYTGIRAKLLQTVLTAALTFLSYEQIVQTLHTFLPVLYYNTNNHRSIRNTAI